MLPFPSLHLLTVRAVLQMYHWQIFASNKPGAMISVLGSTYLDQLGLSPRQCTMLERGLVAYATSVRACITSLGAETGVAKLVGKAVRTYDPGELWSLGPSTAVS